MLDVEKVLCNTFTIYGARAVDKKVLTVFDIEKPSLSQGCFGDLNGKTNLCSHGNTQIDTSVSRNS